MDLIYIGCVLLIMIVLMIQSVMLYKVYVSNLKKEQPKLDKESKEWIEFTNLFKENKLHSGYIVSYSDNVEEFMLRFVGFGISHEYHKDKFLLENVWFECDGIYNFDGYEEECG